MDDLTKCVAKKDACVSREIAGETLIVPVRNHGRDVNAIYTVNELGSMIWKLVDGQTNIAQIVEAICHDYDVSPGKAAEDVVAFLNSLEEAGLIGPARIKAE